jgi:hypothetical protein
MNKILLYLGKTFCFFTMLIIAFLVSCAGIPLRPPSATTTGPRTIILDDTIISEEDVGGFTSWFCYDFVYEEKGILLEVGFFGNSGLKNSGYILYGGGYTGEFAKYRRIGIEHRWDWGPNGNDYAFVIKADGTGLYYDFSNANEGERIKANDVFKCYTR